MLLNKVFNNLTKIIEFPFLVLSMQIKQNECKLLKDNFLLAKLKYRAPKCFDRDFEYPWVLKNLDMKNGKLLDIGSTVGQMLYDLLPKEVEINTLNIKNQEDVKGVKQIEGDIRKTDFKSDLFDNITCISTLEHIGVEGRYGVQKDEFGDIKAMKEILRILKPGGRLFLTVPYGAEDILPINKLYNKNRTEELFKGYKLLKEEYLKYDKKYRIWLMVSEEEASTTIWSKDKWYSLGLFVLQK
ncbi:MAG: DUF268 domain-containing protein [Candidatus Dojkabacteria bacterium]